VSEEAIESGRDGTDFKVCLTCDRKGTAGPLVVFAPRNDNA